MSTEIEKAVPTTGQAAPAQVMKYRPDIDGLRTLAVVPVVIFHAYPEYIPGGFTGVDVFFVISGYLISGILYKEHAKGKFTYANFYSRRVRRIFPGLVLMLIVNLILGCLWLLAPALKSMVATLIAGSLFSANIQLLTIEQGYFDESVKMNPLLHLWSLGVEEQFYIFWPFFASLVIRVSFRKAIALQIIVLVSSFLCNILFLGYHGDDKYSFYFPLSRFWQMAIGGLLAYCHLPHINTGTFFKPPPHVATILSAMAIVGIGLGYTYISEVDPFPGYFAIIPTICTTILIYVGPASLLNTHLLGSKIFVFIGKISYPLYLWHWPLIVYAKTRYPNAATRPGYMEPYCPVILSLVLSVFTLYGVENNLRHAKGNSIIICMVVAMVTILGVAVAIYLNPEDYSHLTQLVNAESADIDRTDLNVTSIFNGTTNNSNAYSWGEINTSRPPRNGFATVSKILAASGDWNPYVGYTMYNPSDPYVENGLKVLNKDLSKPVLYVIGDSHGHMIAPRFAKLFDDATNIGANFPMVVFDAYNAQPPLTCTGHHASDVTTLKSFSPKVVLYSMNWPQFLRPSGTGSHNPPPCCAPGFIDSCSYQSWDDVRSILQSFQDEIRDLVSRGIKVYVATINPEGSPFHYQYMLSGNSVGEVKAVNRTTFRDSQKTLLEMIELTVQSANATLIDYSYNQCWDDVCEVISTSFGEPIFKDKDHFRPYYARNYLTVLDQLVLAALA